jgi:hypothetical protein
MKLGVKTPCQASWADMTGDDRARFCGLCKLNVYNLSALTEAQARELIERREGKVCVRFYERPDGTVMTQPCPVRFRKIRRRLALGLAGILAALGALWGVSARADNDSEAWREIQPFATILRWLEPDSVQVVVPANPPPPMLMGEAVLPPPPPPN